MSTEWDKILPLQRGDIIRIKSFSTYDDKYHWMLSRYLKKKGTIRFRFGDDIFVEVGKWNRGPYAHTIHLHIRDVERV